MNVKKIAELFCSGLITKDEAIIMCHSMPTGDLEIVEAQDYAPERVCSCGAVHTSNPKFHLRYCTLA